MYHVMLVDDEKLTLEYLNITIPQQDKDWQVVALCSDGIEALEWLACHHADLIITDIKMPEMTGLELCRRIKKQYPDQKIIILSGYDEFKFAQKAIQYGVRDYILKPISLNDLTQSLHEMKILLQKEKMEEQAYSHLVKMSEDGKKQLAARFINAVIYNSDVEIKSLYPLIHRMKISLLEGAARLLLISLDKDILLCNNTPAQDIPLYQYMIYQMVLEIAENQKDRIWAVLDHFDNTVVLISADTADAAFRKGKDIYHIISETLQKFMTLSISSSISDHFVDIFEAEKAYYQSMQILNARVFLKQNSFYCTGDYSEKIEQKMTALNQHITFLWMAVSDHNIINQQLAIQSISELMPQYTRAEVLRFGLYWISGISAKRSPESSGNKKDCEQAISKLAESQTYGTKETVQRLFLSIAQILSSGGNVPQKDMDENLLITNAQNYILANYAQPLSLTLVADELGISPNYLSSLFHKEMGESYIKYVTRVRIEHAIQLMKENPQIKIYDIVERVGYVSVKHFSYVFKQNKGMSPSEYQQSLFHS